MSEYEYWTITISLASIFVALIGIATQLRQAAKINKQHLDWNRRVEALNVMHNTPKLNSIRDKLDYNNVTTEIDLNTILNEIQREKEQNKGKSELEQDISLFLNFYSRLAIGVRYEVYDEDITKKLKGAIMRRAIRNFRPYIEYRRNIEESRKNAYNVLEELVKKWYP
jgi:hypothetical protein